MTGKNNQLYFDVPVELTTTPHRHTTEKFVYGVFREHYTFQVGPTPDLAFSISDEYDDDHFYWDGAELLTKDVKLENVSNLYSSDNNLIDQ